MHRTHRYIASLSLITALAAPAAIVAAATPAPQEVKIRVYDREHKDYHNWDDREDHAWHRFLDENHRDAHDFKKAKREEQREYWSWRHNHPD
ncbi:MAG TPA: hypothetical protein VGI16_10575 [Candidatus Acidoferrum sp.]|jgi:hypothetical protein